MRWAPLLLLLLVAPAARAQPVVGVRVGNHPDHGRVVFDWPAPPQYRLEQSGDAVVLHFPPGAAIDLAGARRPPRNVVAVAAAGESIRIGLKPGARARVYRFGAMLVVDALDPPSATVAAPGPEAPQPAPQPDPVAAAGPPPGTPGPATAGPPAAAPRPGRLTVRPLPRSEGILLPYPATTGLALLRRGGEVVALFDSGEPLDLTGLEASPVFAALTAEALGDATMLRLPLAAPAELRARREPGGWVLDVDRRADTQDTAGQAMPVEAGGAAAARLVVGAREPGRVVPVIDPETGLPLLLGTVRDGGQRMRLLRRLPELDLPPTLLGGAVLARSDQVTMRPTANGFIIEAATAPLALDPAAAGLPPGASMTLVFDLPQLPVPQLLERLRSLQASIAAAAPLARMPLRRATAETLLALGMPQEAQAMTGLARGEDPAAAQDARLAALSGAAALLAGRLAQAAALREASLPLTDELSLWRALLRAGEGDAPGAAPDLAAAMPLVLGYAEGLRARLLPLTAQALVDARAWTPLRQLLEKAGPMPELALSRAVLAEADGGVDAALAGYDHVAQGRDRWSRARALRRAVELRLASGHIDAAQAARALEATLFAWRGDAEETAARIRLAELKRRAGDARGALALLRETEGVVPDEAPALRPVVTAAFLAALEQEAPLDAVALYDAYPDLLPSDPRGEAALSTLAERLVELDLADRAATLLGGAAGRSTGPARAALGLRQGALLMIGGDAAAALKALEDTRGEALPDDLKRERSLLAARAQARLGRLDEATAGLRALGPAGAETLSTLLAAQNDWAGAAGALEDALPAMLPAAPAPLDEAQQRLLVRQAALLALAGQEAKLAALRTSHASRLPAGPLATAFLLLTAEHLRGLADLPRLQRELLLFQSTPPWLEALRAGGPVTR